MARHLVQQASGGCPLPLLAGSTPSASAAGTGSPEAHRGCPPRRRGGRGGPVKLRRVFAGTSRRRPVRPHKPDRDTTAPPDVSAGQGLFLRVAAPGFEPGQAKPTVYGPPTYMARPAAMRWAPKFRHLFARPAHSSAELGSGVNPGRDTF